MSQMSCRNCKSEKSWHVITIFDPQADQFIDQCDQCGLEGAGGGVPDVYFKRSGQEFANLTDDMGRPIKIESKRHKAEVMKALGVSEAGDRVNGAPYGTKTWTEGTRDGRKKTFERDRPKIREIYGKYLANVKRH